jgi:hypothetical protein
VRGAALRDRRRLECGPAGAAPAALAVELVALDPKQRLADRLERRAGVDGTLTNAQQLATHLNVTGEGQLKEH